MLMLAPSWVQGQADTAAGTILRVTSTDLLPLTGTWRYSTEDEPGFSSPSFDDRAWPEISTPGQWHILGIDSDVVWYRRHFLVAETLRDTPLALEIPLIADAHEMYVNGVRVGGRGKIAVDGTLEQRSNRPGVYRIPPGVLRFGSPVNVIAMRVADNVGWGGVVRPEFYIGGERRITRDFELQLMRRAGLCLAFLVTGLLYLVFYLGSRQPTYLYYALFSSLSGVEAAALASTGYWLSDSFIFNHILQHGPYHLFAFALTGFLHTFFELETRVAFWVRVVTIPLLVVFVLGCFSLTFLKVYALYTLPIVLGLIVLTMGYGAYVIVSSASRLEAGAQIMLGGLVVLAMAILNDVLNYFKVFDTFRVVPEGMLVFTGSMGAAVAYRFAEIYQRSERLKRQQQEERALLAAQEEELQTARQMQMGLMPASPPSVTELDVAGRCQTANHVGGDLFQYFTRRNELSVAIADVTGHAMVAAIPVVMFSGILDREMELQIELGDRFGGLNRSLCRSLGERTFICFTMAEIDTDSRRLRLASCGSPYPLHVHNDTITELKIDGYPLGVTENSTYDVIEAQLSAGDYLVMYSDGIPETVNADKTMFGYGQTINTVREACAEGIAAEELVDRLMLRARRFAGDEPQSDDMTCVVVKVEG